MTTRLSPLAIGLLLLGCNGDVGGSLDACDAARAHVQQCTAGQVSLTSCDESAADRILAISCQDIQQARGVRSSQSFSDIFCGLLPDLCNIFGDLGLGGSGGGLEEPGGNGGEEVGGEEGGGGEEIGGGEEGGGEEIGGGEGGGGEEVAPPEEGGGEEGGEEIGGGEAQGDGCQGETWEGRCESNTVIWCEGGSVQQEDCSAYNLTCGFEPSNQFYACL